MSDRPLLARLAEGAALRKVALVRAPRIGDFISATPALRALRAALPGAEISLITLPLLRQAAERLPFIDRFIPFPGFPGLAEQLFDPARALRFFSEMQAERFDLAVQMHGSGQYANPFTLMLGARRTAGFVRPGEGPGLLDAALPFPAAGHEVDRLLALAGFLGAPAGDRRTVFAVQAEDQTQAGALLAGRPGPFWGLHPGAHSRTRRWPAERFAEVGRALVRKHGGTAVILAGPGEADVAARVAVGLGPVGLDLAGRTSLPVLGAVLTRLAAFVSNDSGPAHAAYALRAPTVVVWGGEDPQRYGPPFAGPFRVLMHPVDCRPCYDENCPFDFMCLEHITVESVLAAVENVSRETFGGAGT